MAKQTKPAGSGSSKIKYLWYVVFAPILLVVFLLAHFTRSRVVGRLMQLVGTILCVIFWGYAFHMWATHNRVSIPTKEESTSTNDEQEIRQAAPAGEVKLRRACRRNRAVGYSLR